MKTVIIQGQKTEYSIVIPAAATPVEKTAAEELQHYLKKVFGAELAIMKEGEVPGKAFYIGHTEYAGKAGVAGNSKENWIIKMHEGNVILTGGVEAGDRGILYAVYHFLGVRWWTRWEEYIPELTELSLESDFHKEGTPAFSYRKSLYHINVEDFFYEARVRGNVVMEDDGLEGEVYHDSVMRLGSALHMGRPDHVHSMESYYPAKEYFDEHPEWYAWSDAVGSRIPQGYPCLTNESLVEAVIEKLMGYIEEDRELEERTGVESPCFYSISLPDLVTGFCECETCKAVLEKSGASGYLLYFVNKIARAVAEKYPDVKIETLAYNDYIDPPKDDTLPEKNVIIRLAQVNVDIIHGIHDRGNKWYLRVLKAWSKICKKAGCELYIWEYMYNCYFDLPAPVAYRLSDTFRAFYDYGVSGVFVENESPGADMWELNQYLLVHLCEEPYADVESLIDDFMSRFYGPAAEYVKAYLLELRRAATENDYSVFCIIESAHFNYLDAAAVLKGYDLLKKAMEAVGDNPVLTFRILWLQKLLYANLLVKYFDLKHIAERQGLEFVFDREALRATILSALEHAKKHPRFAHVLQLLENETKFYTEFVIGEEEDALIPEELSDVAPENIYQFYFKNQCRHIHNAKIHGFSVVDDVLSSTGKVARLCREDALSQVKAMLLLVTSRNANNLHPLSLCIRQDAEVVCRRELFLEDIVQGGYHLYKVGSVSGIKESGDTRVDIFGVNFEWFSLTGLSVTFPMDTCDVYLSMRFEGELYGGSSKDKDAIYVDRVIVVRH